MAAITKKIIIQAIFSVKGAKQFSASAQNINKRVSKQAQSFAASTKEQKLNNNSAKMGKIAQMGFGQVMGLSQEQFSKFNKQGRGFRTVGGHMANRLRLMTHGMRGFRMEMLGVMFFGMAITRVIGGLMGKSLEWAGVMDVIGAALGILFLPVALQLLDWALIFLDLVGQLTEGQKKWIGIFALAVAIFGAFVTLVGTLALGVGSLILVFGKLKMGLVKMMLGITLIIVGIGFVIGGIIQIIANWGEHWDKVVAGISKVLFGLGLILLGVAIIIGSIPLAIIAAGVLIIAGVVWVVSKIIKHWDKIKEFFSGLWQGIKDGAKAAWEFIKDIFGKVGDLISGSFFGKAFKFVGGVLGNFHTGGVVPQTGPYLLQRGETVTPAGQTNTNVAPTINITANVSSDYDVRRLAEQLKRYWVTDFERASQGRTV